MISARTIRIIKANMLRCRPGDWEHCKRVVRWVKRLGKNRKDLETLIIAAYIHDIGWRDVLPSNQKLTLDQIEKYEPVANSNSEQYARAILTLLNFSDDKTAEILKLISAADAHQSGSDDEAIIVDADNLSKLSLVHLKEKYKKESWRKMLNLWERDFPSRINTSQGKTTFPRLLANLKTQILRLQKSHAHRQTKKVD